MVPLFILMSLSLGTALMLLLGTLVFWINRATLDPELVQRLRRLLGWFVIAVAYLVAVDHLTRLYVTGHHSVERFILIEGGIYPVLFWGVQGLLGTLVPIILLFSPRFAGKGYLVSAALLVVIGGLAQVYVLIIGGQAFPLDLFPGYTVTSSFFDGAVAQYVPSAVEIVLGLGGLALALVVTLIGARVLPFMPAEVGVARAD